MFCYLVKRWNLDKWHQSSEYLRDTVIVLRRMPFEQLNDLMNEMLPEDVRCIDIEDQRHIAQTTGKIDKCWTWANT